MKLSDEEALDLIETLILRYVPNSLDRINALEKLKVNLFLPPTAKCPKCNEALVCLECDEISVDSEVTVRIDGRTVYA